MRARLSSADFPELAPLRTHALDDASVALCDAWAVAADVLSFYQDRIANEGYLRTATERNSILQLGRLIGYRLRPGVSASAYVNYTVDANTARAEIPAGTRVQSVPGPGEKMETFETSEPLSARPDWNRFAVRLSQPQWRQTQEFDPKNQLVTKQPYGDGTQYDILSRGLFLAGTNTQLKPNDALLVDYGELSADRKTRTTVSLVPYRVDAVTADTANQRTQIALRSWLPQKKSAAGVAGEPAVLPTRARAGTAAAAATTPQLPDATALMHGLTAQLDQPAATPPRNALFVPRDIATTLRPGAEAYSNLLIRQLPALRETLIPALTSADLTTAPPAPIKVYALRAKAALFGHNAGNQVVTRINLEGAPTPTYKNLSLAIAWQDLGIVKESPEEIKALRTIPLDAVYDQIKPDATASGADSGGPGPSFAVADLGGSLTACRILSVRATSVTIGAAVASRVTLLDVDTPWLTELLAQQKQMDAASVQRDYVKVLREVHVYAQSEELGLAEDPLQDDIQGGGIATQEIELDRYYDGLKPGMWVIASGERSGFTLTATDNTPRTDIKVDVAERTMIASVRHGLTPLVPFGGDKTAPARNLPDDTLHTYITLASPLSYSYKRETFALSGNIVHATHGETRRETLGAGDATQIFQQFTLKSPPLTYVAAASVDGVVSTLQVRVNKLLWHETTDVSGEGPNDREYTTRRDDSEATSIIFGDGNHGARLPTGQDNVAAVYRSGLGAAGNVRAGQLTLPADKPLGVTAVNNPMRASGGADADTLAQARVNAPLSVTALDRLVSIQDYADFTSVFAGIGKAAAVKLQSLGIVHVTIAGIDDGPIDVTSDLFRNLVDALHEFGDPNLRLRVEVREALAIVIQAGISLAADYAWEDVQPRLNAVLIDRFGFAARTLGQPLFASEIIAALQGTEGVAHVVSGTVTVLGRDDLISGLVPQAPQGATASNGTNGGTQRWFALGRAGAPDQGQQGWLEFASAFVDATGGIHPAQIAYLPADIPDCLILELVP
ncbi:MAG TPA: putative baseplate assembly protein [Rudaea sp.]|nr:putative baseplate assembly protein [Rudaea sp.]